MDAFDRLHEPHFSRKTNFSSEQQLKLVYETLCRVIGGEDAARDAVDKTWRLMREHARETTWANAGDVAMAGGKRKRDEFEPESEPASGSLLETESEDETPIRSPRKHLRLRIDSTSESESEFEPESDHELEADTESRLTVTRSEPLPINAHKRSRVRFEEPLFDTEKTLRAPCTPKKVTSQRVSAFDTPLSRTQRVTVYETVVYEERLADGTTIKRIQERSPGKRRLMLNPDVQLRNRLQEPKFKKRY